MTVFCDASTEEALANDIVSQLQREDNNNSAEFAVKEIRLLNAENRPLKWLQTISGGRIQAPVRSFHSIVRTVASSGFLTGQSGGLPWHSDGNHSASRGIADGFTPQPTGVLESGPFLHA